MSPKMGVKIKTGDNLFKYPDGFPGVDLIDVGLRDRGSRLKPQNELDEEVTSIVEAALEEQGYQVVMVRLSRGIRWLSVMVRI
jgi:hypothetical protein